MTRLRAPDPFAAGVVGALGLAALAGSLVPLRAWLGNTNVALVLVVGIVGSSAVGGRSAGVSSAVAAALAYDLFHTRPHYTMVVDARVDRLTTLLLLVVGVLAGEIVVRTRRAHEDADRRSAEVARLRRAAHLAASARPAELVVRVEEELRDLLDLWTCRFRREPPDAPTPRLTRTGVTVPPGAPALTADPTTWTLELPVTAGRVDLGRFLLVPHEPRPAGGFDPEARRDAVALADQLGAVLALRALDTRRVN